MSTGEENISKVPVRRNSGDEIDLKVFFKDVADMIGRMANSFVVFFIWLRRITLDHIVLIIIIMVVALGLHFGFNSLLRGPSYTSTLIFRSQFLSGPLLEKYIEKLNQDSETRKRLLGIQGQISSIILGFEVEPFVTEEEIVEFELFKQNLLTTVSEEDAAAVIERLRLENRSTYEIRVKLSKDSVELLAPIEESLLNYLAEKDYVRKRIEIEKRELGERKQKIQEEIKELDSLKGILLGNLVSQSEGQDKGSNNVILGENQQMDPLSVFREYFNYYLQEQNLERQLFLQASFEVLDGFNVFEEVNEDRRFSNPLVTVGYSIGAAYVILFLTLFNRFLIRRERTQDDT